MFSFMLSHLLLCGFLEIAGELATTASYMSLRSRQESNLLLHLAVALSRMK